MAAGLSPTVDLVWLNSLLIVLRGAGPPLLRSVVYVPGSLGRACALCLTREPDSFMSRPSNLATAATGLSLSPLPTWRYELSSEIS